MNLHQKKKIICLFGEKCKFRHFSINKLNDVLKKVEDLKQDNELLKSELKAKCIEIRNLEKKNFDVTNESVHVLAKPIYLKKSIRMYQLIWNQINKPRLNIKFKMKIVV